MLTSYNLKPASGVWISYDLTFGAWNIECQYNAISQTLLISINLTPASGVEIVMKLKSVNIML